VREQDKICDALAKWEQLASQLRVGLVAHTLVPRFHFRRRCFFQQNAGASIVDAENVIMAYQ